MPWPQNDEDVMSSSSYAAVYFRSISYVLPGRMRLTVGALSMVSLRRKIYMKFARSFSVSYYAGRPDSA